MPKYKNTTKDVLKFRAHNSKGIVKVFELKSDEEMESDREVSLKGLEEIKSTIKKMVKKDG